MNALDILSGAGEPESAPSSTAEKIGALDAQRAIHQANLQIAQDSRADAELERTQTGSTTADIAQLDREIEGLERAIAANLHARKRAFEFDQEAHFLAERAARGGHWKRYQELTGEQIRAADALDKAFTKLDAALVEFLKVTDERETHLVQAMRGVVGFDRQANVRGFMGRRVVEILLRSSELAADHNKKLYGSMVTMLPLAPRNTTRASETVAADSERITSWIGKTIAEAIK